MAKTLFQPLNDKINYLLQIMYNNCIKLGHHTRD